MNANVPINMPRNAKLLNIGFKQFNLTRLLEKGAKPIHHMHVLENEFTKLHDIRELETLKNAVMGCTVLTKKDSKKQTFELTTSLEMN